MPSRGLNIHLVAPFLHTLVDRLVSPRQIGVCRFLHHAGSVLLRILALLPDGSR